MAWMRSWVLLLRRNLGFCPWTSCSCAWFWAPTALLVKRSADLFIFIESVPPSAEVLHCERMWGQLSLWNGNICTFPLRPSPAHLKEWLRKKGEEKASCQKIWHQLTSAEESLFHCNLQEADAFVGWTVCEVGLKLISLWPFFHLEEMSYVQV